MKTFIWWLYILGGIALLLFLAPWMISQRDTFVVLLGVAALILYGVWTWKLWAGNKIRQVIIYIKRNINA